MKKNTKINQFLCAALAAGVLAITASCGTSTKAIVNEPGQFLQREVADNETLRTLIPDYSEMKEDNIISAFWVEPGFGLSACRTFKVYKTVNFSKVDYPWAEKKLEKSISDILSSRKPGDHAHVDACVFTAIIAMKPKLGFFKRFSPYFDDHPSVAVEMVIIDESTKRPLCRICHFGKDEKDFKKAVENLAEELRLFMSKKL